MSFATPEPTNPRQPAPLLAVPRPPRAAKPASAPKPPRKGKHHDEPSTPTSPRIVWASAQIQGARDQQQDAILPPHAVGQKAAPSAITPDTDLNAPLPNEILLLWDNAEHDNAYRLCVERGQMSAPFIAGVFDGMGGHEDGREHAVAAATVAETLTEAASPTEPAPQFLTRILSTASRSLVEQFGSRNEFHGSRGDTTATILHVDPVNLRLTFGQVGDSAAILVRGSCFEIVTPVHNLPFAHNRLTRALKNNGALPVDHPDSDRSEGPNVASVELEVGDVVLLCTDGFYQALNIADMGAALRELFMVESLGDLPTRQPVTPDAVAHCVGSFFQRVLDKRHDKQDNASLVLLVIEPARDPDAEGKP